MFKCWAAWPRLSAFHIQLSFGLRTEDDDDHDVDATNDDIDDLCHNLPFLL